MSGGDHAEGQLRQRRPRARNADTGAPHPPDPRVGQARLGPRPPRAQSPWPGEAAVSPLTRAWSGGGGLPAPLGLSDAPGCRCWSPAKRQARAAGTRQGWRRAGAGTRRRRHRRGAGTRCAAGGIRAGPALTWVRGRGAAGGGGGIPSGMPPASPAPSPSSAAAREEGHRAGGEGGGSWAGRGGWPLSRPAPASRAPASRASPAPQRPKRP